MGRTNRSQTERIPSQPLLPAERRRRAGRWRRRLLASLLLLVTLVVLAPVLIARTPLRNGVAALALARLRGDVHVGGASLWWFSPPVLTDVEVRDAQGRTLLSAPRIEGSKTLIEFLGDPSDLGTFRVTGALLSVICAGGQTNLEDALAGWLEAKSNPADTGGPALEGIGVRAELEEARVVLQDDDTGRQWVLDPVEVALSLPRDRRTPARVQLHTFVTGAPAETEQPGRLDAELAVRLVEGGGPLRLRAEGELRAENFPLAVAGPILRRLEPGVRLEGRLDAGLALSAPEGTPGRPDVRLEGSVTVRDLALSDPRLGADRLTLKRVELPCRVALEQGRLQIEEVRMKCDVGEASVAGTLSPCDGLTDILARPGLRAELKVDLARLATLLPSTLLLSKEARITSGGLSLHLRSSARGDGVLWEGGLRTADLQGTCGGQRIVWKEPLSVAFTARQAGNAPPVFERFRCDSDFLQAEASGSIQQLTFRADYDLGRLSEHLAGLIDLGPIRVQGRGSARATARRIAQSTYRVEADAHASQLRVAGLRGQPWAEDNLTVRLDLTARTSPGRYRINGGGLHVLIGQDGVDVDLLEPIADVLALGPVRARVQVHGDLARWQGRLGHVTDALDGLQLGGRAEIAARLNGTAADARLDDVKVSVRDARFRGLGLSVDEPALDVTTAGRWRESGALELSQTRLSCPTVSAHYPSLRIDVSPAGALQIAGAGTVQGDVARLQRWLLAPPAGTPDPLGGSLAGRVDLRPVDGRQEVTLDLTVQNLALGSPAAPAWREPAVRLVGRAIYDAAKDVVEIGRLRVESPALTCDASGQVARLSRDMELSLSGRLGCDLKKAEPQLRAYLGSSLEIAGRDERPFRLGGSLGGPAALVTALTGEAGLGWQSVQAYGCQVGPADVKARLADGWVRVPAIETTINQGRLRLEPSLHLGPGPAEAYLAKGKVIDHARLTPAACAGALGYALPALADVARAEGELSLELDGGRLPLADFTRAQASGRLIIHAAQVSPGPLVRELGVLLKGPATLTLARDEVVPFQVINGRVHHRDLELHFPELTVRTSGSVGLDGSLALVAEMPVPPKWLGSGKLAEAVGKQTIRLPIGGTLSRPKLDEQALRAASARFARDAAGEAIRHELDSKLKKALRPRP